MKTDWLTTQVLILIIVAMLLAAGIFIGLPVWLVATNRSPPTILSIPIGGVLIGASSAAVAWSRAIMRLPPAPDGTEFRLVPTISPPQSLEATEDELLGRVPIAPLSSPHVAEAISEADMVSLSAPLPPTAPATPESKKRFR